MTADIKVSIITPCYNAGPYLRPAVESVLNQTVPAHEMIVVDDGSTDDSASVAESFGGLVKVVRQENQGESVARNRGISMATGTHLLFLDADDLLHAEAIQRLSDAARGTNDLVVLMGCGYFLTDINDCFEINRPTAQAFFPGIESRNFGPPHGFLTPIEIVRQAGGFAEHLQFGEDWDMWCQIGLTGVRLKSIDYVGGYYRRTSTSQLATSKMLSRTLGNTVVLQRLIQGILERRRDLLEVCGESVFWQGWAAMHRARRHGATWKQVQPLTDLMQELVRVGPQSLRKSTFGRTARILGVRWAESLRNLTQPPKPFENDSFSTIVNGSGRTAAQSTAH